MEAALIARGMGCAYPSIVTLHGEILHSERYDPRLADGDLLLADVGAETPGGWAGDVTRTWPASGRYSSTQREIYEVVLAAQKQAIAAVTPGGRYRDVHVLACQALAAGLVDLGILRGNPIELAADGVVALLFPHGVGHLLGLDVHDMEDLGDRAGYAPGRERAQEFGLRYLRLDRDLEPGMAVTIEPGFYICPRSSRDPALTRVAGDRLDRERLDAFADVRGIRIEDDVLVDRHRPRGAHRRDPEERSPPSKPRWPAASRYGPTFGTGSADGRGVATSAARESSSWARTACTSPGDGAALLPARGAAADAVDPPGIALGAPGLGRRAGGAGTASVAPAASWSGDRAPAGARARGARRRGSGAERVGTAVLLAAGQASRRRRSGGSSIRRRVGLARGPIAGRLAGLCVARRPPAASTGGSRRRLRAAALSRLAARPSARDRVVGSRSRLGARARPACGAAGCVRGRLCYAARGFDIVVSRAARRRLAAHRAASPVGSARPASVAQTRLGVTWLHDGRLLWASASVAAAGIPRASPPRTVAMDRAAGQVGFARCSSRVPC